MLRAPFPGSRYGVVRVRHPTSLYDHDYNTAELDAVQKHQDRSKNKSMCRHAPALHATSPQYVSIGWIPSSRCPRPSWRDRVVHTVSFLGHKPFRKPECMAIGHSRHLSPCPFTQHNIPSPFLSRICLTGRGNHSRMIYLRQGPSARPSTQWRRGAQEDSISLRRIWRML